MTVKDLIDELRTVKDKSRIVVMSSDAEGNSYSPLSSVYTAAYAAYSTHGGEVGIEELTDEYEDRGYCEEDIIDGVPALVLGPT